MKSLSEHASQIEALVRAGQQKEAARAIAKIDLAKVPRARALRLANLARRAGLPNLSARLLNPYVRPRKLLLADGSGAERAEYAAALQRLGSFREAQTILEGVSPSEEPSVLLFRSFCHFAQWDYDAALPLLRELSLGAQPGSYQRRVAQVNLAAALIYVGAQEEAAETLAEIRSETEAKREGLLLANALELSSQLAISGGRFSEARSFLSRASALVTASGSTDRLFIEKWAAIANAVEFGEMDALRKVEETARARGHFETLREADFFLIALGQVEDRTRLSFLYFGTPYESYRRRIQRKIDVSGLPSRFERGPSNGSGAEALDLLDARGDLAAREEELAPGNLPHAALCFLLRDFYRRARVGEVFSALYPNDFYHPDAAPARVYQAITRLRRSLAATGLGLRIEGNRQYAVDFNAAIARVAIPSEPFPVGAARLQFEAARRKAGQGRELTSIDLQKFLGLSKASANKLLAKWNADGWVERQSGSRAPRYRLAG